MGWISLFGCLTTAYGPAVVLFLMLVAPKAQLFMVFILRFANNIFNHALNLEGITSAHFSFVPFSSRIPNHSSFCWILAMLAASIAWTALETLIPSAGFWLLVLAACQECARYAFFRAYARAENNFSMAATNGVLYPLSDFTSSLAGGLAFGVTQTVMLYGATLGAALGPGTVFSSTCPQLSTFSLAGAETCESALFLVSFDRIAALTRTIH
jgi:hypothetical protein